MLRKIRIDNSRDLKLYIIEIMEIRIRILIGVVREDIDRISEDMGRDNSKKEYGKDDNE